jgi:SAM-dependent methyltransferase
VPVQPTRPALRSHGLLFFDLPADSYDALSEGMRAEEEWTFGFNTVERHLAHLSSWAPSIDAWARRLPWPKGSVHVDIGAGPGLLAYLVARQGYHSIAVELEATNLAAGVLLQEGLEPSAERSLDLWVADIFALPLPDRSVDFVTVKEVLHHLPNVDLLLRELARVLKPGGKVYVWEPYWPSRWIYPIRWLLVDRYLKPRELRVGIRHIYYSLGDYRRMFRDSAFRAELHVNLARTSFRHYLSRHRLMFGALHAILDPADVIAFPPKSGDRRSIRPEDFISSRYLQRALCDAAACKRYLDSLV